MNAYRLRIWTGPIAVTTIASAIRQCGYQNVVEGTEHVHVTAEGSEPSAAFHNLCADLLQTHRTDFGLRWYESLRRVDY